MDEENETDPRYELRLDPGRSLPDAIAERLRALIDDGVFRPGTRLPTESELARKMRVARSSIRTALQRLEAHGVVEVRRGVGWHVRRAPAAETGVGLFDGRSWLPDDLFEVRIALEGLAVSLAATRASEGEIADIAKQNAQHAEAEDADELLRTDIAFHEAIFRASRNDLLFETYQQVVGQLQEWRYRSFADRAVGVLSAREHAKVVRFLRNGDSVGARAAMNGHLHRLYDSLPDIRSEPLDSTYSGADSEPAWHDRTGEE